MPILQKYKLVTVQRLLAKTKEMVMYLGSEAEKQRYTELEKNIAIINETMPTVAIDVNMTDIEKSLIYTAHANNIVFVTGYGIIANFGFLPVIGCVVIINFQIAGNWGNQNISVLSATTCT